jgi:outer membrane protein with beta-barrel domain
MTLSSKLCALAAAAAFVSTSLHAQATRAPGSVVNGRVVVQVFVSIADEESAFRPVGGLELGFFRLRGDSAVAVTDRSGSATILLAPGEYRLESLEATQWRGIRYSWSRPIYVREGMGQIDLQSSQATVTRVASVAAVSDGETETDREIPRRPTMDRSHSSGFFIGIGAEDAGLSYTSGGQADNGSGGAIIVGYGFDQRWALYGDAADATMTAGDGSGTYSLSHVDLGARVHFRTGPNVVVPFLQFGLTGRAVSATVNGSNYTGTGGGVTFGAGLNAHFTPSFALSGSISWATGSFNDFRVDNYSLGNYSVDAMTARLHLGVIWFPQ